MSDGQTTGIVISRGEPEAAFIMVDLVQAEDILIQLGGVLNTLKGVKKKLPLRDRLRLLRG